MTNIIGRMFKKWDSWRVRKKLAKGNIHCVLCGKALRLTVQKFLRLQYVQKSSDLPTCNACQSQVMKAGVDDVDKVRVLKKS